MHLEDLLTKEELMKLDSTRVPNGFNGREFAVALAYLGDTNTGDSYIAASRVKEQVLGVQDTEQARELMGELADAGVLKFTDGDYQMPLAIRVCLKQLSYADEALRSKVIGKSSKLLADRIAKAVVDNFAKQREAPTPHAGGPV